MCGTWVAAGVWQKLENHIVACCEVGIACFFLIILSFVEIIVIAAFELHVFFGAGGHPHVTRQG